MQNILFKGREKRRYVRIDTVLNVRLKTDKESTGAIYNGTSDNISEGGLCMKVEERIDELLNYLVTENAAFNVSIQLSEPGEEIKVDAIPRWTSSRIEWVKMPPHKQKVLNVGLAFRDVPEDTRNLIQRHIRSKLEKKSDNNTSAE